MGMLRAADFPYFPRCSVRRAAHTLQAMERNASVADRLTLAPVAASRRSVARTCVGFARRCLETIGESYVQSGAYHPYWIGAVPFPESLHDEACKG
jgi:hypothetical protein